MNKFLTLLIFLTLLTACCRTNPQLPANKAETDTLAENLLDYNRLCIEDERMEIEAYIDSVGGFTQTEDGYYYKVDSGEWTVESGQWTMTHCQLSTIKNGDRVSVAYSLELLDGTICSQSTNGKAKTFTVGKREVETGLDMAIVGKHVGDEFEIIIPYNLAWGVSGDGGCIPPRTPILYRVKIINN
ncbi:MAG: FKBP-type peptidyl-prolyl cis-trans isomerase [Paludibacteraceae bacterium]|nr:FKBP-type peptidyl-prolyl cis-trans isomerase [Paludibacteraceae bacterium]